MPRVVRLEQTDFALGLLLRDLAENVLGEVMLEFGKGGHPIVDPIKQDQDHKAGKRAKTKPDEQDS